MSLILEDDDKSKIKITKNKPKKRRRSSPSPPKKKRRVAKRIRDLYPNKTDDEIRAIKQQERKESNRRSAQKSRENQKREMNYLTELKNIYEKRVEEMENKMKRHRSNFLRRAGIPIEEYWACYGKEAIKTLPPPNPQIYHESDKQAKVFLSMDPFEHSDPFGEDPVEPVKYMDDEDVEIEYDFENMNVSIDRDEIAQLDPDVQARLSFALWSYRTAAHLKEEAKKQAAVEGMMGLASANSTRAPHFEFLREPCQWVGNGAILPRIKLEESDSRDISPVNSSCTDEDISA